MLSHKKTQRENCRQAIAVFGRGLVWDEDRRQWRIPGFNQEKAESFSTGDQLCLLAAAHLFKEYEAPALFVCGGAPQSPAGNTDIPALAQVMKAALVALDIPAESIQSDERPCSLLSQLACLQEMLVRGGAGGATLIVNRYCVARTKLLLNKRNDLMYLRRLMASRSLRIQAAEEIVLKLDPRWEPVINAVYRSEGMKRLIAWESKARRGLKKRGS